MRYLLVLALVGCAAVDSQWTKEGATLDDQNRDYDACFEPYKARAAAFGMIGASTANEDVRKCMTEKGWKPKS